jgi:hypothetical protein
VVLAKILRFFRVYGAPHFRLAIPGSEVKALWGPSGLAVSSFDFRVLSAMLKKAFSFQFKKDNNTN